MSWNKDKSGNWIWTADGVGNPNKPGDNQTPPMTPEQKFAAAFAGYSAPGADVTSSKAYLAGSFDNSKIGLKDSKGKILPAKITGQQFQDAIQDTKNNAGVIEGLKRLAANVPGAFSKGYKLSATGHINPTEVAAIVDIQKKAYASAGLGTTIDLTQAVKDIRSNANSITASISRDVNTNTAIKQYTPQEVSGLASTILAKLAGRSSFTTDELTQLTNDLNVAEKKTPTKTVTASTSRTTGITGDTSTTSTTTPTTSGGLDEQAYITSKIKANKALQPEVQRQQDIGFGSWMDTAMRGGASVAGSLSNG